MTNADSATARAQAAGTNDDFIVEMRARWRGVQRTLVEMATLRIERLRQIDPERVLDDASYFEVLRSEPAQVRAFAALVLAGRRLGDYDAKLGEHGRSSSPWREESMKQLNALDERLREESAARARADIARRARFKEDVERERAAMRQERYGSAGPSRSAERQAPPADEIARIPAGSAGSSVPKTSGPGGNGGPGLSSTPCESPARAPTSSGAGGSGDGRHFVERAFAPGGHPVSSEEPDAGAPAQTQIARNPAATGPDSRFYPASAPPDSERFAAADPVGGRRSGPSAWAETEGRRAPPWLRRAPRDAKPGDRKEEPEEANREGESRGFSGRASEGFPP
jgi:hypothetical protein